MNGNHKDVKILLLLYIINKTTGWQLFSKDHRDILNAMLFAFMLNTAIFAQLKPRRTTVPDFRAHTVTQVINLVDELPLVKCIRGKLPIILHSLSLTMTYIIFYPPTPLHSTFHFILPPLYIRPSIQSSHSSTFDLPFNPPTPLHSTATHFIPTMHKCLILHERTSGIHGRQANNLNIVHCGPLSTIISLC